MILTSANKKKLYIFIFLVFLYNFKCICKNKWNIKKVYYNFSNSKEKKIFFFKIWENKKCVKKKKDKNSHLKNQIILHYIKTFRLYKYNDGKKRLKNNKKIIYSKKEINEEQQEKNEKLNSYSNDYKMNEENEIEKNNKNLNDSVNPENVYQKYIRNFCILAHIDSGKSTLADRFLELTNTIKKKRMKNQFLDMMSLEREKGITIKLKAVRMNYKNHIFNLIDTPGHSDFYHEVKRSLNVCEGAILLIDGCKGIQSQTLNIFFELKKHNVKIIPVINKIDLSTCLYEKIKDDLIKKFNFKSEEILKISAKYGFEIENLFQKIISDIPYPTIKSNMFFRGIVFDSFYHQYKGVVLIIKVLNGFLKKRTEIFFINSEKSYVIQDIGYLIPEMKSTDIIRQGDIAYVCSNIRNCDDIQISETIVNKDLIKINSQKEFVLDLQKYQFDTYLQEENKQNENHEYSKNHVNETSKCETKNKEKEKNNYETKICKETNNKMENISNKEIHEGIKHGNEINVKQIAVTKIDVSYPSVYCNIYSVNDKKSTELEMSLNKLKLNDASFSFKKDICETLGKGFKCGFNGLLHLNIIQERVKREYDVETIITAPSVNYLIKLKDKYIDKKLKEKLIDKNFDIKNINIDEKDDISNGMFFMTSNVNEIPKKNYVDSIYEPYVKTNIVTPDIYQKYVINECFKRRGIFIKKEIINDQIIFLFEMPLSEILINFLDEIKSYTKGYGSMSYENFVVYKKSDLYKINIYINKKCIESLSFISHKVNYYEKSKNLVLKIKNLIDPHQFLIVIQAAIESKIFVSEKIKPLKKNVTQKCYGGDITRRRKLIEKQNEGKKKMFNIGKVKLPPNIFIKLFDLKNK
ncbi:GTP-binding protein, putative [Plasmodium gallinaceum]|uniref:Translation factor GUF1 homolog, mitochondrial n=1 Tax=Plasmodium gallinaceum TaxID=5849 RepID=A0A1J1GZD6_PLAGA|nr:GTP-binding protein, putative [Plasmodium gallinaceum]CRG96665.1 GTP-binding protein, putative [Plasmodium gallinaceum]